MNFGGVYMIPGWLSYLREFTPVPSCDSVFVYMIPPENVTPERVMTTWVHPGCCTGLRIPFRYEILQQYHVQGKRRTTTRFGMKSPPCRLERVAHAYRHHVCNFHSHMQSYNPTLVSKCVLGISAQLLKTVGLTNNSSWKNSRRTLWTYEGASTEWISDYFIR